MAGALRTTQFEALLTRFLGVPENRATDPNNPYLLLKNKIGASQPRHFLGLSMEEINAQSLLGTDKKRVYLTLIQKKRILELNEWQNEIHPETRDWTTADPEEFEEWADKKARGIPSAPPAPPPPPPPPPPPVIDIPAIASAVAGAIPTAADVGAAVEGARTRASQAETFIKGTKRSFEDYKVYKDKRQWNSWHRQLRATATQHGLENILNSEYSPDETDADALALWNQQQKFMFAVFTATLKETSAMEIVRQHSDPTQGSYGNAQGIYQALKQSMQGGLQAQLEAESIERQINEMRLDTSWTKSCEAFVNRMATLFSDHQNVVDTTLYEDAWYIRKLEAALSHNGEFRQFFTSTKVNRANLKRLLAALPGDQAIPDERYIEVLQSCVDQAKSIDNSIKMRRQTKAAVRTGRGIPYRGGPGREGRGGRTGQGRGRGRGRGIVPKLHPDWIPDSEYAKLTPEAKQELYQKRLSQANEPENTPQRQANKSSATSDWVTLPTTVEVPTDKSVDTSRPNTQPGSVIRHMLSNASQRAKDNDTESVTVDGKTYHRSVNITYRIVNANVTQQGALVDGGSNGGLAGDDCRILEQSVGQKVDVSGIAPQVLTGLPIVQCAALVETLDEGPIILIMSQYAGRSEGKTIHSKAQLEDFGCIVRDTPRSHDDNNQIIITPEGFVIPMHIRDGLHYIDMSIPTDEEMEKYPNCFITHDSPWNPSVLDDEFLSTEDLPDDPAIHSRREARSALIDEYGEPIFTRLINLGQVQAVDDQYVDYRENYLEDLSQMLYAFPQVMTRTYDDLDMLRPNFGWVSKERIRRTLEQTTQYYRAANYYPFRKHFRSRFPAANVRRIPEWFAMDTYFANEPAADDGITGHGGCTMAQLYGGVDSHFLKLVPMRSESDIPKTLQDFIRDHGAMRGLKSDNAKAETSIVIQDILRMYCIQDKQSEPYYQHQNPVERRMQDVKRMTNNIMDRTGCPGKYWLICMLYVVGLLNVLANAKGEIPNTVLTGEVTDVSPYIDYHFWQPVFYEDHTDEKEKLGRWCGPTDRIGDALTYWVLTNDTHRLIARSNIRPAQDAMFPNRRERPPQPAVVTNVQDFYDEPVRLPKFSPDELVGKSFIRELGEGEDVTRVRALVENKIFDRDKKAHQDIKFLIKVGDEETREIMDYNQLSDLIAEQEDAQARGEAEYHKLDKILDHRRKNNRGAIECLVLWENGEETWEPLRTLKDDDPITVAKYAKDNDLLDQPGWKRFKKTSYTIKLLHRLIASSRRKQRSNSVRYKFGVRIPRNYQEAVELDRQNNDTLWQDAVKKELEAIDANRTYHSIGYKAPVPGGYTKIPVHFVFDCKQDMRRKARLVAGGHKTPDPEDPVYSSVAALRSLRIVILLAELNGLKIMAGDIGYAYLQSYTKEKVVFIADASFGPLEGHTLIIDKAIYGLRSSGARYHERFAETMYGLGFTPSYADPDVWFRDAGDFYEYVVVYVDDLIAVMTNPKLFFDILEDEPHNYTLKGCEEPKYHLGADIFRDQDNTLCIGAQTYIRRLLDNYLHLYGELPYKVSTTLKVNDHPELDTTRECTPDEIAKYHSLLGACQWMITLCRFDIAHAIMTLSRFRNLPHIGHVERLKRVIGYVRKYPHASIRFRTGNPDHESYFGINATKYDWMHTIYGSPTEEIPSNAPTPKGKPVRMTTFVDANLMHDLVTGRSCTGILHLICQTPIQWFTKRQAQVETATYGSEFMAARQAVEQIMDLRYTLRMLGVPIDGPSWLFGDNRSVVNSTTIPHSTLSKRWNALMLHDTR